MENKALECLEENKRYFDEFVLKNETTIKNEFVDVAYLYAFNHERIKQALEEKSKKEQAFEIIKNKSVMVEVLKISKTLKEYNNCAITLRALTEQEFNLIKELL